MDTPVKIAKMEQQIDNIEKGITRIETSLSSHIEREALNDRKYSGKWVEKVVIAIIVVAVGGLIAAIKI